MAVREDENPDAAQALPARAVRGRRLLLAVSLNVCHGAPDGDSGLATGLIAQYHSRERPRSVGPAGVRGGSE